MSDLLERLAKSQKVCFDAGLHVTAMDIQSARAEIQRLLREEAHLRGLVEGYKSLATQR